MTDSTNFDRSLAYLVAFYGESPQGLIWIGGSADKFLGRTFTTLADAARYATELDAMGDLGVYHRFTTLARKPTEGRGKAADSAGVYAFALDMDIEGPGHKGADYPKDREQVEKILAEAGAPPPTAWVASGGGYYPQWWFPKPIDVRNDDVREQVAAQFADLSARFIAAAKRLGFKLDNVRDLARVFRIPGTTNRKAQPIEARFEGVTGDRIYLTKLLREVRKVEQVKPEPISNAADHLFDTPEPLGPTPWTLAQAEKEIDAWLIKLAGTVEGDGFNNALRDTSMRIGHFVPAFLTEEDATARIVKAIEVQFPGGPDDKDMGTLRGSLAAGIAEPYERAHEVTPVEPGDRLSALRAQLLTLDQLRLLPQSTPLIKGVLNLSSATWLIGAPGGFKSFVALDWACHVATGKSWQGHKTTRGRVLYVVAEGVRGFMGRIDAWASHHGGQPEDLLILPVAVQARGEDGRTVSESWRALVELAGEIQPSMVVLDTQARLTVGLEENSNTEMGIWIRAVDTIKAKTGACVLVVHHTGRNGQDARGASALDGAQDMEWKVEREPHKLRFSLGCDKNKDGSDAMKWTFDMVSKVIGQDEDGDDRTSLVITSEVDVADVDLNTAKREVELVAEAGRKPTIQEAILKVLETQDPQRHGMATGTIAKEVVDAYKKIGERDKRAGSVRTALARMEQLGVVTHPTTKEGEPKPGQWLLTSSVRIEPEFLIGDAASRHALAVGIESAFNE